MCDRAAPCVGIIRTFLAIDADRVYLLEHCGNGHTLKPETAPASEPPANVCGLHHHPRPCAQCHALWRRGNRHPVRTATRPCLTCEQPFESVGSQSRCEPCRIAARLADVRPAQPKTRPCRGLDCPAVLPIGSHARYCPACQAQRCGHCSRSGGHHSPACGQPRQRTKSAMSPEEVRRLQDDYKAGLFGRMGLRRRPNGRFGEATVGRVGLSRVAVEA